MTEKATSDVWWKNVVCYCVDVKTYADSDGDGWGDLPGLTSRLGYLRELGVGCLWLTPCYPSPLADDGYDVSDYYAVHERLGSLGDFVEMVRTAHALGIRVIMDLVVNHTSREHPWFQEARRDPHSRYRSYYVWSVERPPEAHPPVFPDEQTETWTWDEKAGAHYFHHYYAFEPDLAFMDPLVHDEVHKIIGFWLQLGVDGFRVDSLPFLIDQPGADGTPTQRHEHLRVLRDFLSRRRGDAVLLGEANVPVDEQRSFFGAPETPHDDSEAHLLFDFAMQARLWLALARGSAEPVLDVLRGRPQLPRSCQYAVFARHHDELTFEKVLTTDEAREVCDAFDADGLGAIYGRGLRRRLASLLDGDERRIRLMLSLVMSLPGMPVLLYGDELGLRDNLELQGRLAVRVPMPWHQGHGFSAAPVDRWLRPPAAPPSQDEHVNVADQRHDPDSLLTFVRHLVALRRDCPEIGYGETRQLPVEDDAVLALRFDWLEGSVVVLHNLSPTRMHGGLSAEDFGGDLVEISSRTSDRVLSADEALELEPFGIRWLRVVRRAGPAERSGESV